MKKRFLHFNTVKDKIFFSYVILLIIPLSLIALTSYNGSANILRKNALQQFNTVSELASQQFDQYFKDLDSLSLNVMRSSLVQAHLRQSFVPSNSYYLTEKEMAHFLKGIYRLKPGLSSIVIYGNNKRNYYYHPHRSWNPSFDSTSEAWYKKTLAKDGAWVISGKRKEHQLYNKYDRKPEDVITFSRVIKDLESFKPLAVLAINVNIETLEELTGVNTGPSKLVILDEEGHPVVSRGDLDERVQKEELVQVSTVSPFTNWKTTYATVKDDLLQESKYIRNVTIAVAAVLTILALISAQFISAGIVKPLARLKKNMKEVEKGNFHSKQRVLDGTPDEIGELTNGFNHMVERIATLVEEIRVQERKKKETELNALQARINPHFMYNTLNGMRWVAMMEGHHKLADLLRSFVSLLRFSAKNEDTLIVLQHEIDLLNHYVDLMKMRHEQFAFHLKIEGGMSRQLVIPFLLQPAVENAIFHGIVPLNIMGRIDVCLYTDDRMNIALVRDNGVGMSPEKLATILSTTEARVPGDSFNRIGLRNVYDRLQLQFGQSASLKVTSEPGKGTEVRMIWPKTQTCEQCPSNSTNSECL